MCIVHAIKQVHEHNTEVEWNIFNPCALCVEANNNKHASIHKVFHRQNRTIGKYSNKKFFEIRKLLEKYQYDFEIKTKRKTESNTKKKNEKKKIKLSPYRARLKQQNRKTKVNSQHEWVQSK